MDGYQRPRIRELDGQELDGPEHSTALVDPSVADLGLEQRGGLLPVVSGINGSFNVDEDLFDEPGACLQTVADLVPDLRSRTGPDRHVGAVIERAGWRLLFAFQVPEGSGSDAR